MSNLLEEPEEDLNLANAARAEPAGSSMSAKYKSIMFMLARNFYKLKYLALVLAFLINFLMLFYKARKLTRDTYEEPGDDVDEDDIVEVIMMDPDEYYIEHMLKAFAFIHSLVAFSMMVAYYVLKVMSLSIRTNLGQANRHDIRIKGASRHFQTREGDRSQARVRGVVDSRAAERR